MLLFLWAFKPNTGLKGKYIIPMEWNPLFTKKYDQLWPTCEGKGTGAFHLSTGTLNKDGSD